MFDHQHRADADVAANERTTQRNDCNRYLHLVDPEQISHSVRLLDWRKRIHAKRTGRRRRCSYFLRPEPSTEVCIFRP